MVETTVYILSYTVLRPHTTAEFPPSYWPWPWRESWQAISWRVKAVFLHVCAVLEG